MLTVRATTLEKFRSVIQDGYGSEAELVNYIMDSRSVPPNENMRAGSAWHRLIQDSAPAFDSYASAKTCTAKTVRGNVYDDEVSAALAAYHLREQSPDVEEFRCSACGRWHLGKPAGHEYGLATTTDDGFSFTRKDWLRGREVVGEPGLVEMPWGRTVPTRFGPCRLTGQTDAYLHPVVQDHKTCWSTPDVRGYERSLQWRVYLQLFEADQFRYNLFAFHRDDDTGECRLRNVITFNLFRYPGMADDVAGWLARFLSWCNGVDLLWYLDRRDKPPGLAQDSQTPPAAARKPVLSRSPPDAIL